MIARRLSLADLVRDDGIFADGDWVESKDQDPGGDVRLLQLADVGDGVFVDKSARFMTLAKAKELRCTFLERGDILVARMPDPLGRACVFPGATQPCVTVVDVCIIRPGKSVDRRWLLHAINSPSFRAQIVQHIKGTTRQRISRSNLGTIELNVPSFDEQRRIAELLDKADAVRRKRGEAIALTNELLRSAFLEMFGDPASNPRGWSVAPLSQVTTNITDGEHATPKRQNSGIMLLSARNIKNGFIDLDAKVDYVPDHEWARMKTRCAPVKEDVLLSCSGTIGRVSVVRIDEPFGLVRSVAMLRLDKSLILPDYVEALLQTTALQRAMMASANKSAQANLFLGQIGRLKVPVPPMHLQERFCRFAAQTRELAERLVRSASECEALFASLAQRAFRGELTASTVQQLLLPAV